MNEQIRNLENEVAVLMHATTPRGKVYDYDTRYRQQVQEKLRQIGEMKVAEAQRVRLAQTDPVADAAYAAYVERNMAKQALMNDNEMPLAHTLKAQAIARGETPAHVAPSGPQPVGRGGIFSRAG